MYVRRVNITNVRSIAELTWELPADVSGAGWHVILGDNGAGKSSFLRSIALALIEHEAALGLREFWPEWIRSGVDSAQIEVLFDGARITKVQLSRGAAPFRLDSSPPGALRNGSRWFRASYGPYRRFTGGDAEIEKLFRSQPDLAQHLSLFSESVALTESLSWLQSLKFKGLEGLSEGSLLLPIIAFVNQPGFLPHGVRLHDVTSSGVVFADANGFAMPVQDLSDGYRSILSMTFELVRQMALTFGPDGLFSSDHTTIAQPGVVIIDEVDAHLHPTWQRTVGVWFRKHFPRVQFIVSTHSPLICQAAEVGTVFRLPRPGADPAEDRGEMVEGLARNRLLYGNVLDAYGTGVFGEGVTRSDSALEKLERLAELNTQELVGTLSDDERQAQTDLREMLPTDASATQAP